MRLSLYSFAFVGVLAATSRGDSTADPKSGAIALEQQRAAVATEISKLDGNQSGSGGNAETSGASDERLNQLRAIDALYAQHKVRLQEKEQLETEKKRIDHEIDSLDKFEPDEPKPYSFLLWDGLKDQLAVEQEREKGLTADGKTAKKQLASAHQALDQAKAEVHPSGDGDAASAPKKAESDLSDLKVEQERAQVALREADIEVYTLRTAICQAKQKELSKKIEVVGKEVAFSAADRDKQLDAIALEESRLKAQRGTAQRQLQQLEEKQRATETQLSADKAQPAEKEAAAEAWRGAADTCQAEVVILDERIEWLARLRKYWRRRFEVATTKPEPAKLQQWHEELSEFRDELHDNLRSFDNRQHSAATDNDKAKPALASTPTKLAPPPFEDNAVIKEWRALNEAQRHELAELCAASVVEGQAALRLVDRFESEMKEKAPTEKQGWLAATGLSRLLGEKVVGEEKDGVTLGTLVILLIYVVGGVISAWAVSRLFRFFVLRHFRFHRGKTDAIHSILFYTLCAAFGVMAFRVLNIPIAAFAFLGGAIAIAAGFGSQDIMNNFMSGIILLAEQPIRVGDVVTLGSTSGVVLHIGLRSTRLQTEANYEVIVPNKSLLDEQITNFTLSDNIVQSSFAITVDRETKITEAKEQILKTVFAHPEVVKSLHPLVLVKEIDNYWLIFEVRFWIQYNSFQQCARVQSEIMEVLGDIYRPLTDEEKEAKAAAKRATDATSEVSEEENSPAEDTASVPECNRDEADQGALQAAQAKNMIRKLGRKVAKSSPLGKVIGQAT
ncbi:MAG TPA: mechanosensitive ion channel domain-containing protein [Pirellulales bacterium]|jgi:small-conductance mechanosensitive channel